MSTQLRFTSPFFLILLVSISLLQCKKEEISAATSDEYLTCDIDGQSFIGRPIKASTGDLYSTGLSNPYLSLVYGDDDYTFYITVQKFAKQSGVTYTLDGRDGVGGYVLFVNDKSTAKWTNTSNVFVTVTNYSNNIAEGTFTFTLPGVTNKVFTNGRFRSKVVQH